MLFRSPFSLRLRPCILFCTFLVAAAPTLFILSNSRFGSAPSFYTARFSLRQRPRFLYLPILAAAAPPLFILPNSRYGTAPLFILPISRCDSIPSFYTVHFSLRQRTCILYCPFLVAAAPRFLYCPFLVTAAPRFLYCPFLVATADRKSTRLNSSHVKRYRMPYSA